VEDQIDRLYGLPLDQFTPARDELARRLRRQGNRDAAAEVGRLRKPNLVAWALNQVRRSAREKVDELVAAGERLHEAQQRLVAEGDSEGLRRSAADERGLVEQLVGLAEQELEHAGHPSNPTLQAKLRSTAHATAADPEARGLLELGRLIRDYEISDLGLGLSGAGPARQPAGKPAPARQPAAKPRAAPPPTSRGASEREIRAVRQRLDRARTRAKELGQEHKQAQRRAADAERAAARAATDLERALADAERRSGKANEARGRVAELERALAQIEAQR